MRIRRAQKGDLDKIVALLADDELGIKRETLSDPLDRNYHRAFEIINKDENQHLMVVENEMKEIVGTLQLTFIQYLTYRGGQRAQIEAVRIGKDMRGKGIGELMIKWAIEFSSAKGAHVVQLTTDKLRPEALTFYENLGFVPSHEGMKLHINQQ